MWPQPDLAWGVAIVGTRDVQGRKLPTRRHKHPCVVAWRARRVLGHPGPAWQIWMFFGGFAVGGFYGGF